MGMAADALDVLTGVRPNTPAVRADKYNIDPSDTGMAASALRSLRGEENPPATFADRFSPAEDQPLKKTELPAKKANNDIDWSNAITDIPKETANEFNAGLKTAADSLLTKPELSAVGAVKNFANTASGVAGLARAGTSIITGPARSLIGHTLANAERFVGENVVNPALKAAGVPEDKLQHPSPEGMYETAKGDVDTALSAARTKVAPQAAPRTIAELKDFASKGYEHPDLVGLEIKPDAMHNFALKSELELSKKGLSDKTAPTVVSILRDAQEIPHGSTVTGQNIVTLRRTLQEAAANGGPESKAAKTAIDHLDEWMPNIRKDQVINGDPEAAFNKLQQANADYTAAKHAELVDSKLLRAELRSASAHSGMGVTNQVRGRMADILLNPKERRGFTDEELGQMEKIVYGTGGQNILRGASNVLSGGGGVGSTLLGLMTGGTFPALGMALRKMSNSITIGQAEKLSEMIRSRPGLSKSADKFEEAASAFNQGRTAKTVAGLNLAARNFANNLTSSGINIGAADLIRGLQGPGTARGEQDQQ